MTKPQKSAGNAGFFATVFAALAVAGCASAPEAPPAPPEPTAAEVQAVMKASFSERGIAKLDRLDANEMQALCAKANASGKPVDDKTAQRIQAAAMAAVKYPADGNYIGDWKAGERIAQNGRGLQFSDAANTVNGANCYACHQVSPQEISHGNPGPSLLKYGTLRGVKNPKAAESEAIVKYTWQRIWNTHSVSACSNMPRFGDAGILTEAQVKDVMALLLDPESPVNK
jgi:L-cysteine S-thiosulfotransferase